MLSFLKNLFSPNFKSEVRLRKLETYLQFKKLFNLNLKMFKAQFQPIFPKKYLISIPILN